MLDYALCDFQLHGVTSGNALYIVIATLVVLAILDQIIGALAIANCTVCT